MRRGVRCVDEVEVEDVVVFTFVGALCTFM
jgi:hypothetical protein